MHLKSLEIQGFKSFPDKIKLEFGKGLTAVVGPNGSGKSNIGDAVRWVLGEQSLKTLRGNKMEDVIFSGTQYRKSVGYAQVTLNIDNSDGVILSQSDVLSITRKLYRSGDSEYLINGSQVRLKDVYELFMDTGLGRDGYSIIGQGRVAEIISAKSNERRKIFEEAAGISKFRYKKEEAQRRLISAEDNILRLKDIINELEARVEPLKIQSEKAQKFIEYSEQKKTLEVSVWIKRCEEMSVSIKELEDKILISNSEYENLDNDITKLEENIQNTYHQMQESNIKVDELQNQILEAEKQNSIILSEIAVCKNDVKHGEESKNEILEKQRQSQQSSSDIDKKIEIKTHEKQLFIKEKEDIKNKIKALDNKLAEISKESSGFNQNFELDSQHLNTLFIKQSEYNLTIKSSAKSIEEMKDNLSEYLKQENGSDDILLNLKKEQNEIAEGLTLIDEKQLQINNKIFGYKKLYDKKTEKLSELKKEYEKNHFLLKDKQQRIKFLTDLEKNMEGFNKSVKEIIKIGRESQIKGIKGSIAQLISVDEKYSTAIETALGAALQNIAVINEETAKRCIRLLKEKDVGRATFLPITSVSGNNISDKTLEKNDGFIGIASELVSYDNEYDGIIKYLLGRIIIAEDIDFASVMAKKYSYRFKIVTLDGQVINAGGSFTGGSAVRSSGVLTRKNEISKLEEEMLSSESDLQKLSLDLSKMQAEADKMVIDIDMLKDESDLIQSDMYKFTSEKKRVADMLLNAEQQKENIISAVLAFKQKISHIEKISAETQILLENCNTKISEYENNISINQEIRNEYHKECESISNEISSLKLKEIENLKNIELIEMAFNQLGESKSSISESNSELDRKTEELNRLIAEKLAIIDEKNDCLGLSAKQADLLKSEIAKEQLAHRELEKSATFLRADMQKLNESKEKYSTEITRLTERKMTVQKDYDVIICELLEQYQMTRSEAMLIVSPIDNMLMAQRDLNDIKSKIRNLGNVNVAAIEEYKEVYDRFKFMSEQLNDVLIAKRELEKLIKDLTEDMKKRFTNSFENINYNFKSIFMELFGGGRAELTLTDPEDVLESGIEIKVAPPGKVINNLSLLSGGEQAFVAIAIYFAILKIKPAPFCILDEIEAALDDVNVSKYASYLHNFTDTTQFILITHRRGTMEQADVLYGVTMQEKGISKLLKMSQENVDKGDI